MAAVVWFVLFWTSFPVKSKSRRFSKTVANDFGSVFIQTLFPSDYTRSLSVSLLNDSVLTTLCLNPPSNLCILCQWKTDVNSRKWILTNHAVLWGGGGLDFVKWIRILLPNAWQEIFFSNFGPQIFYADFCQKASGCCWNITLNWQVLLLLLISKSIENLRCALFFTVLMSNRVT